jgi:transposase-like protein
MNLNDIAKNYNSEEQARVFLERQRWPNGAICPHCGVEGESYRLKPKAEGKTHVRPGVWKCGGCRKQFTVKVGTIFEDSHIPLATWLKAIHLLCSSKKGMSAHQLHRMLGVTYKSAWFMAHRIRYAMSQEPLSSKLRKLRGTVEVDETYVGGRQFRGPQGRKYRVKTNKVPVVALVERGGDVRSFAQEMVTGRTLKQVIHENVSPESHIMTDEHPGYGGLRKHFRRHSRIRHSFQIYARKEGDVVISTNTIEGYFSILKRGINGVYHHVGKQHLHRYLSEFDFRYNSRKLDDGQRSLLAIKGVDGKRLMLRDSSARPKNN